MTITRPATTTALLHPRPLQSLRRCADASVAAVRRTRRTRRRPTLTPSLAPPLTVWQIDPHELRSAVEDSHW